VCDRKVTNSVKFRPNASIRVHENHGAPAVLRVPKWAEYQWGKEPLELLMVRFDSWRAVSPGNRADRNPATKSTDGGRAIWLAVIRVKHASIRTRLSQKLQPSIKLEVIFCVRGVMTAPCGVPSFVSLHWPRSLTPAVSHFRIRVSDPVLDEPDHPAAFDFVEERPDVQIDHCPTLQVQPHDRPRMARGQSGSLLLSLYVSFIHYFTPVYPDAIHARVRAPGFRRVGNVEHLAAALQPRSQKGSLAGMN
jgi:hypothetical protein